MAKEVIATFNNEVDKQCNYCMEDASTAEHIRWHCHFFESVRQQVDEELAEVPRRYFTPCLKCGIAPAMEVHGKQTYWGTNFDPNEN